MIDPSQVAPVFVTRGDVPMERVLEAHYGLGFRDGYIWNNGDGEDLGVYGRYAAIEKVDAPVIITQDDDCVLPLDTITALLAAYEPDKVVCNVPARFRERYTDSGLVGFGAIFDRDLPQQAFNATIDYLPLAGHVSFRRTCDIVFTMLTPLVKVDLPYTDLPWAHDESRMWKQPNHFEERDRMRKLCRAVRDRVLA